MTRAQHLQAHTPPLNHFTHSRTHSLTHWRAHTEVDGLGGGGPDLSPLIFSLA